jgi:uncharacterized protein (TIGR02391 family)
MTKRPEQLIDLFPEADALLGLSIEELGLVLLRLAKQRLDESGIFHSQSISYRGIDHDKELSSSGYPRGRETELRAALAEGWAWLDANCLLIPAPSQSPGSGFRILSRRAKKLHSDEDFKHYLAAVEFPKSLIHPAIAEKTWAALTRGDLDEAVFAAFKAVEVAVRTAGNFSDTDIGVQLMRKAFDKSTGPLADASQPESEREALAHLFAGAIGSYKNPHSHRTISITDPREAQQMIVLASHLLGIVDMRKSNIALTPRNP